MSTGQRQVAVVPLGGTITSVPDSEGGVRPSAEPAFMQRLLGAAQSGANGLPETHLALGAALASAEVNVPTLVGLIDQLNGLIDAGASGVVVTTGTDTLEEVAFVLDLLWVRDASLVVLGAMRHGGMPGHDGAANLRDGLRVAAHPAARGHGVLVTMNGVIHHAWQVRKSHTGLLSAFRSTASGPVGAVQEEVVRMTGSSVVDRPYFELGSSVSVPPVALMKAALGDDGRLLTAVGSLGYHALVIEVMGGGSVPPAWVPKLRQLSRTMPVAYSSRTLEGPTLQATYGGSGAELDLRRLGILPTGLLDGLKARLLLGLLLAVGADRPSIAQAFTMFDVPRSDGTRPVFHAP